MMSASGNNKENGGREKKGKEGRRKREGEGKGRKEVGYRLIWDVF